ncbi:MAG: translation initiation factor IF-2 N-terminal domain-containing protein, partial [Hungatella sp.]
MRVSELAKELGKTSKEVLDILQKNHFDVKSHASNVSDDQMSTVKRVFTGKTVAPAAPKTVVSTTSVPTTPKEGTETLVSATSLPQSAKVETSTESELPKKKITAVYRPQNSQQMRNQRPAAAPNRNSMTSNPVAANSAATVSTAPNTAAPNTAAPNTAASNTAAPNTAAVGTVHTASETPIPAQTEKPQNQTAAPSATANERPVGQGGYQGNRESRPQGTGYQGSRPAGSGYQGSQRGGYQGNREPRPAGSGSQG